MEGNLIAGRYKEEKEIAISRMGRVVLAYDTRLRPRKVVLKFIPPTCDPELLRRLTKEALALASINHPGIVTIHDFEDHGQESFIVEEYVEGITFRDRLAEHGFTPEEVLEAGRQMAEALCAAHDHGIVHRDLKPANVMLVPAPHGRLRIKIIDFGLAKTVKPLTPDSVTETFSETLPGTLLGTVPYMSPEQVAGQEVDSRTDIYAMGLVLYEMITRVNPFRGENLDSTKQKIETLDPQPMRDFSPNCPPELDRIVRRCLRKPQEERYQSAHEVLDDLRLLKGPDGLLDPNRPDIRPDQIRRGLARALFVLIQAGYLAMYTAALRFPFVEKFLELFKVPYLPQIVMFSALCGAALRLYFIAAAALDYPHTGRLFHRVFPLILVLDVAWAASPLTLFYKLGYPVLLMMVGLACLPFAQNTLMSYAYAPRGGRISTARGSLSIPKL